MIFFKFSKAELFPFSYVQEQVKSGESNSVTHGSGVPFSLNNGKCPEIPWRKLLCNQSDGL